MTTSLKNMLAGKSANWLLEMASDAMLIVDQDGYIRLANPAAERLFGFTHEQFTGLTIEDLIPQRLRAPHHESRAAYTTHPTPRTMGTGLDIIALRQDGKEFAADVSLTPLGEGQVLAIVHDITQRQQTLTAAREFADNIVATIQEPLVVLDAEERVISANRIFYQIFQLTEKETVGQIFFELNEKQWDIPVLRQLLADELPKKHRVEAFELQHEFPGIGSRTVLIRARLIEGKFGQPNMSLLTFLNITERKRLEAERARMIHELESANEELNNFAYVISHDLKAPLRAIGSLADWIVTDQQERLDDEGREHLRLLVQRVRRMNALIDGVLRYSRIGKLHETAVAIDINELVHEVLDLLAPPPHIVITVAPGLPSIRAEKAAIHQVLQNLIANAIRYLDKPEGRIEINCVSQGDNWRFSVADNGPGIEARHFARIFQLFQTLNPRDRLESTGVGLAIVKKIVEQCGGEVGLESVPGQGSTFFFTLPKTII
ncbi:MAG: sensor histidine kinase [Methylomicrobium sp.]